MARGRSLENFRKNRWRFVKKIWEEELEENRKERSESKEAKIVPLAANRKT